MTCSSVIARRKPKQSSQETTFKSPWIIRRMQTDRFYAANCIQICTLYLYTAFFSKTCKGLCEKKNYHLRGTGIFVMLRIAKHPIMLRFFDYAKPDGFATLRMTAMFRVSCIISLPVDEKYINIKLYNKLKIKEYQNVRRAKIFEGFLGIKLRKTGVCTT